MDRVGKFYLSNEGLGVILLRSAPVVELVDAPHSKCGIERCVGSSPTWGTTFESPEYGFLDFSF